MLQQRFDSQSFSVAVCFVFFFGLLAKLLLMFFSPSLFSLSSSFSCSWVDAIGAAVDRQETAASEAPVLQGLRARLQGLVGPMDEIEADVQNLVETLKPYTDQAARIDSERTALEERETDIAEGEALLQTDRATMDADRRELRRARTDHADYLGRWCGYTPCKVPS